MISKYRKVNIKNILLGTIIVVILGGLVIALSTSKSQIKTPATIAQEFGKNLYTVDEQKVADYKNFLAADSGRDSIGAGVTIKGNPNTAAAYLKLIQSLDKNIQPLMTEQAYTALFANRQNTSNAEFCAKGNYTLQVTDFILAKNLYGIKEAKAGYYYEATLKFTSTDGKNELTDTTKGYIGLLKENGQWKVSIYKLTLIPKLYNEIMLKQ